MPSKIGLGVKRKQSADSALSEPSTIKRQRVPSGAHALHGMKEGLVEFTEVFRDAMTGKNLVLRRVLFGSQWQ
jgi:hypothetical protein